jgi:hypothetical protein
MGCIARAGRSLTAGEVCYGERRLEKACAAGSRSALRRESVGAAFGSFCSEAAKPPALDAGAQAGLLSFHAPRAGRYRVSLTTAHWVDVVDGGNLVVSRDFQGQRDCEKVHKIIEFELSGNKDFVLQLSNAPDTNVSIAITPVKPN